MLIKLCKQYEHSNSHLKFILDNTIFVWLSWFEINWLFCFCCFCSQNICPDRDGAGTREGRREKFLHGSASNVGVGIFFRMSSCSR